MKKNNARAVEVCMGIILSCAGLGIMTAIIPIDIIFDKLLSFINGTGMITYIYLQVYLLILGFAVLSVGLLLIISKEEFIEFFKKLKNIGGDIERN